MCCVVLCFPLALGIGKLVQLKRIALIVLNFTSFMRESHPTYVFWLVICPRDLLLFMYRGDNVVKPKTIS